jgi:site-specific DNA-methyltransferase (adenine-specific)
MTAKDYIKSSEKDTAYKPDILTCLANLSNDEVFTPPSLANAVLDLLPQQLFTSPNTKFLDPVAKSGVFLREIARRLMKGLENAIPDEQERRNHIFTKQVYGIAITELTAQMSRRSAYCSKTANGKYSVCTAFDDEKGNIRFVPTPHTFSGKRCIFCGASESEYGEKVRSKLESHAYEFIHTTNEQFKELQNMKFDVIIGNPPYQLSTSGGSAQATPLYNLFVEQAKKLSPRYLCMIIPSRWFAGGMGLDKFRDSMLTDNRVRVIVDYPNAKEVFPGTSIGGGVNYFLWDRDNKGECEVTNVVADSRNTSLRKLDEFDVFVRNNDAIDIIHKVRKLTANCLSSLVSPIAPFALKTSFRGKDKTFDNALLVHGSNGITYMNEKDLMKGREYIGKYKVLVSQTGAEHAAEPSKDGKFRVLTSSLKVIGARDICTHSYLVVGALDNETEAISLCSYLKTKFARFLLLQAMTSIHISKNTFQFVPTQDFSKPWTDEELYKKYDLTNDEIAFIDSMIRPMDTTKQPE